MRKILIAVVALAALTVPAGASAATRTARGHGLTAKLSWRGTLPQESDLQLQITQGGSTVYDKPITSHYCGKDCNVGTFGGQPPVSVVTLGAGETDVVANLYTGGAHCCTVAQVFYAAPSGAWTRVEHDFGDPGYRIEQPEGSTGRVFVTADDAFAYTFTDYADSGLPLQILSLRGSRFADVTAQYPAMVRTDAARWLKAYHAMAPKYANTVGVMAAWAADEARLGKGNAALAFLERQAKLGRLNGGPYPVVKGGSAFVAKLRSFLRKQDYLP